MSNARYIEIDSTYRDRNQWPNPGEFQVLLSQSGSGNRENARDPVSRSSSFLSWKSNEFNLVGPSSILTGDNSFGKTFDLSETANRQTIIVEYASAANNPQKDLNYYTGAILEFNNLTPPQRRRITRSRFLYQDGNDVYMEYIVNEPFSDAINVAALTVTIEDPTDLNSANNPYFFIPEGSWLGAAHGPNAYTNFILYNHTRSLLAGSPVYRKVTGYDTFTHLLTVDTSESTVETNTSGPTTSWALTDEYRLRLEPPILGLTINNTSLNNNTSSTSVASLPLTSFNTEDGFYKNSWITMLSGASAGDTRLISRYIGKQGKAEGGSLNTIQFPSNFSSTSGFYNLSYVQITSGASSGNVRQIISYDGNTKIATVNSNFGSSISLGDGFTIKSIFVCPNFSSTVSNLDQFEILPFSKDNHNPLNYSGSVVSQQEMVCYEIELLNLVLPNRDLSVGIGNRISFYPYLYVEFFNISSASAGNKFPIYTNNPNAAKAVFRVPIDDVPNPVVSSFIKIDGGGMTQTLKFKPNDNLFFAVKLPNGQVFTTQDQDYVGPLPPRAEIQISASFGIKRL
jgi:hypothetical protein